MRRLLALAFVATAACGTWTYPVGPVPPAPPAPGPTPPGPGPGPQPTDGPGTITEAGYAAAPEGATEEATVAALGAPFRTTTAAGYRILVYTFAGTDHVAWFWVKDGRVERKSRL